MTSATPYTFLAALETLETRAKRMDGADARNLAHLELAVNHEADCGAFSVRFARAGVVAEVTMRDNFRGEVEVEVSYPSVGAIRPSQARVFGKLMTEVAELAAAVEAAATNPEACPGCGCLPGDGTTDGCEHPEGCGFNR